MSELPDNLSKIIEENSEKLQKFEEWISSQAQIPKNISRAVLIRFLKVCKFDLEKAEKLLDINVKFKIKHQYLFTDRNVNSEQFLRATRTAQFILLPKQSKEGYSIEVTRLVSQNPDDFILKDIIKSFYIIHDMQNLIGPDTNGIISIYDANGFSWSHFMKCLSHAQTVLHHLQFGQESTCVDVKQIHIVNCSQTVSRLISFMKPFLTKEIRDTMHFHSTDFESLYKFIDREYLPAEFGGCECSLDDNVINIIKNINEHSDYLSKNENFFILNE